MRPAPPKASEPLARGQLAALAYRLGAARATGVLTVLLPAGEREVLIIRRGALMTAEIDPLGRRAAQRLARIASVEGARFCFDGGTAAYPPGAPTRQLSLAIWARSHLEGQLDATGAHALLVDLAGVRLGLRRDLAPDEALCDETDRRILAAMSPPRRLEQIWPLARTPRFRMLSFIHFLRAVGALELCGVAAPAPPPERAAACRLLGVAEDADRLAVKRAYRRLARALHPDLHPLASSERRRSLESKLAAVNDAYRELLG